MKFEDLVAEYEELVVGELIVERVTHLVRSALTTRDTFIYGGGERSVTEALGPVTNDFFEHLLFSGSRPQLEYAISNANNIDHFDALITRQLNQFLARSRRRTVVDNLIDRSLKIAASSPHIQLENGLMWCGATAATSPSLTQLHQSASVGLEAVPRIFTDPHDNEPMVYTTEDLEILLVVVLEDLAIKVSRSDLDKILSFLLTPWINSVLGIKKSASIDGAADAEGGGLTPEEIYQVESHAQAITKSLTEDQVTIFRYKVSELSDAQLAEKLGVSRPTAAKQKEELFRLLEAELEGLAEHMSTAVLGRIVPNSIGVPHG